MPEYKVGMYVMVTDGTPDPPPRFNRKLAAWQHRNWKGYIKEVHPDQNYIVTTDDRHPDTSYMVINKIVRTDDPKITIKEIAQ